MGGSDWRPGAGAARQHRARLNAAVRRFFTERGVLEVETPLLSRGAPLDPSVESWRAEAPGGVSGYLHTSPEYAMKRLLADGAGDIYQLAHVFRGDEQGPRHNPEFSLLEWYRVGYDDLRLMDELVELVFAVASVHEGWTRPCDTVHRVAYADLFHEAFGLCVHECTPGDCAAAAAGAGLDIRGVLDRDGWLDALLSMVLEPAFPPDRLTLIFDFPESQAVLARPSPRAPGCASRFELYWGDLELANGFHELTDPEILDQRMRRDRERRAAAGQSLPEPDAFFVGAMRSGLPDCAGVAVGMDRLLMRLLDVRSIDQVIDFPWGRS